MPILTLILLVFAFVFFVLEGLGVPSPPKLQFLGWGLALWVLAVILGAAPPLMGIGGR
jgi:hypothetical protein